MTNGGGGNPTNPGMQPSGAASSAPDRQPTGSQPEENQEARPGEQGAAPGERGPSGMPEQSYGTVPQDPEQEADDSSEPGAEGSVGPAGGQA